MVLYYWPYQMDKSKMKYMSKRNLHKNSYTPTTFFNRNLQADTKVYTLIKCFFKYLVENTLWDSNLCVCVFLCKCSHILNEFKRIVS